MRACSGTGEHGYAGGVMVGSHDPGSQARQARELGTTGQE